MLILTPKLHHIERWPSSRFPAVFVLPGEHLMFVVFFNEAIPESVAS